MSESSNERLPGLLGYELRNYIEDKLINYELSNEQVIDIQRIIDNWYYMSDEQFNQLPHREHIDDIIEYYRYRIKLGRDLYLLEYYQLLNDLTSIIHQYNLHSYIEDIITYITQRLDGISRSDLDPLIHPINSSNRLTINLDTQELDLYRVRCSDNEAYEVMTELYNSLLRSLGQPKTNSDINDWENLTIEILSRGNIECQYMKNYIQQLFKRYQQARSSGRIERLTKNYVIIG